ncbi:hypothetical protein FRB90_000632 [Tulasnella sp. 427]|nr:hypothetical protein FRB90_000632 [Tulasnella sp. 427]
MSSSSSPEPSGSSTPPHFLDTVEGEIALFRGITQARPVGLHRHFHVLAILQSIKQETGQHVTAEDLWTKLKTFYNLEALEELEDQEEDSLNEETEPPKNSINYQTHPHFKKEYTLPQTQQFEELIVPRRAATEPSSPSPEPPIATPSTAAQHARKPSNSTSTPAKAMFDSEGELTEEEEDGRERKRSRSVKTDSITAGTTGDGAADEDGDVDMAAGTEEEVAASPAASTVAATRSRARTASTAAPKEAPKATKRASRSTKGATRTTSTRATRKPSSSLSRQARSHLRPPAVITLPPLNLHPTHLTKDVSMADDLSTVETGETRISAGTQPEEIDASKADHKSLSDCESPFDLLPTELVQAILRSTLPQIDKQYYCHLFPKRQVSKRWLETIDSCPGFWLYLCPGLDVQLQQMILKNSAEHVLDVEFEDEGVNEERMNAFYQDFTPHIQRFRTFTFRAQSTLDLSHFITKPLPNLRTLKVDVTPMLNTYLIWPAALNAPLLDDITLFNCGLKWESLKGLRNLEVIGGGPCFGELAVLLRASPNIERLVIGNNWKMRDDPPQTSPIHLPKLRTLTIDSSGTLSALPWLLRTVTLPGLEELKLEPVYQLPYNKVSQLYELFDSVGTHVGSCAMHSQAADLEITAQAKELLVKHGKSSIGVTMINEGPPSEEWAIMVQRFVRSLPVELREGLKMLKVEAHESEKGSLILAGLLPLLPALQTLTVGYSDSGEDHGSLVRTLRGWLETADGSQKECQVYLNGGKLRKVDQKSLEDLVAGLHIQGVESNSQNKRYF